MSESPRIPESHASSSHASSPHDEHVAHHGGSLAALTLGAIGIVFGDIGTSPLYTLHECLTGEHGVPVSRENVFGVVSLIIWSMTMVVTIKYLAFMMKADNEVVSS